MRTNEIRNLFDSHEERIKSIYERRIDKMESIMEKQTDILKEISLAISTVNHNTSITSDAIKDMKMIMDRISNSQKNTENRYFALLKYAFYAMATLAATVIGIKSI